MSDLTKMEVEELILEIEKRENERAESMPTEQDAINTMFNAYLRLKELGWMEAIYCPKDGSKFDAITAENTGIFPTIYRGEWPNGSCWGIEGGDLWPSRPILFKPK